MTVLLLSFPISADTGETEVTADRAERYDLIVAQQRGARPATDPPDARGENRITWVGFHPSDDKTTIFIKTAQPSRFDVRHDQDRKKVIIDLPGVRLGHANFGRFLDTSHFRRGIELVEVDPLGQRGVRIRMTLDSWEEPSISDTGEFIFVDLPYSGPTSIADPQRDTREDGDELASLDAQPSTEHETPPPAVDEEEIAPRDETEAEEKEQPRAEAPFDSLEDADDAPDDHAPDKEEALEPEPEMEVAMEVPRQHRWAIPLALGGLMVAGGGFGLHLLAERERDPVTSVPRDEVIPMTQHEAADIERRANRMDTAALGLIIAGGTATAIGLTGWLLSSSDEPTTTATISTGRDHFFLSWTRRY